METVTDVLGFCVTDVRIVPPAVKACSQGVKRKTLTYFVSKETVLNTFLSISSQIAGYVSLLRTR